MLKGEASSLLNPYWWLVIGYWPSLPDPLSWLVQDKPQRHDQGSSNILTTAHPQSFKPLIGWPYQTTVSITAILVTALIFPIAMTGHRHSIRKLMKHGQLLGRASWHQVNLPLFYLASRLTEQHSFVPSFDARQNSRKFAWCRFAHS